jgi:hypothetical protein
MKYYFWCNGYEQAGIVKADDIGEAKHKVIMSQGICKSIDFIDDTYFDNYDVAVLIS